MKITIPGRPVPAVRMTQRSKYKSKQAQRYLNYKDNIGWTAKNAGIRTPIETNVHVMATAVLHLGTRDMDVDNIGKSVLDGLNGVAWIDDRQVTKLTVEKMFLPREGGVERMEIEIKEVS